jgi:hypothetical protein
MWGGLILLASFSLLSVSAFSQTAVCRLLRSYTENTPTGPFASSNSLVGEFNMVFYDDSDEIVKLFHHDESGLDISAGVMKYNDSYKGAPVQLKALISFTGKPGESYEALDGAEAETILDKHWRWLSVSDNIELKGRSYTFSLGCEKRKTRPGR